MKQLSSSEIRTMFLEFFKEKQHMVEPGAPLVPINDDTLLWINSGVAALKKYFDGSVKPSNPRIVNIQKSLRTNDIDNVGRTARHHTFFEMMGNFSIGDYFKKDAIAFAYEFLFSEKWLGLDIDKAYFSVHTNDDEAYNHWVHDQGVDPSRILRTDDNYWMIGNGPSGPNSEIFYDRGVAYDPENIGEKLFFEDLENDRYVEVWNIVFSQYDAVEGQEIGTFKELPQKNIDTGMGFERLVSIVQEAPTNFDTDLFLPIIEAIGKRTDIEYASNPMAYRVIADHIRSLVFTLADGANFSNEGRGYVLRRLLRRAVRFGKVLNIEGNFLNELVEDVVAVMKDAYPYIVDRQPMIQELILNEEKRFAKTLVGGERLLLETIEGASTRHIDGKVAFKLYDTYGFPIELTQEIAQEHGFDVDLKAFEEELLAQKERARSSRHKVESMGSQNEDLLNFTEASEFVYETLELKSEIIALFKNGKRVDTLDNEGQVVFAKTPFYAESGGQVADTGMFETASTKGKVLDVQRANGGQNLHTIECEGTLSVRDEIVLHVDRKRRVLIRKNHSAVHLLQASLRENIGDHVTQAGSYVNDEYLRFDFAHYERLTKEQIQTIETQINQWIFESLPIVTEEMSLEAAKETGAMALFSENYGDVVRVVTMGDGVSIELCGGTHATGTGELGLFVIESEESVGSGVRRITGRTSEGAYRYMAAYKEVVNTVVDSLKLSPQKSLVERIEEMKQEGKDLKVQLDTMIRGRLRQRAIEARERVQKNADGISFVWVDEKDMESESAKELVERIKETVDIVVLANTKESSVNFIVGVSDAAVAKGLKAGDIAKLAALTTGGNGGGRPQFAQAGGKKVEKLAEARDEIMKKIGI